MAAGAAAGGFLAVVFYDWTVRCNNAAVKADFATDEMRRNFAPGEPGDAGRVPAGLMGRA